MGPVVMFPVRFRGFAYLLFFSAFTDGTLLTDSVQNLLYSIILVYSQPANPRIVSETSKVFDTIRVSETVFLDKSFFFNKFGMVLLVVILEAFAKHLLVLFFRPV